MAVTKWSDIPNYDEWGKDTYWSCDDWKTWYYLLKEHFGTDKARYIWNYAYAQGTALASHWDCRTYNSDFREFVKKNNLNTLANAGMLAPLINVLGGVFDFVGSIGDTISNVAGGLGTAGKVIKVAIPVSLIGAGVYFGFRAFQNLRNPELEMRRRKMRADLQAQRMGQAAQAAKFMV
jgi:hypothetical protein